MAVKKRYGAKIEIEIARRFTMVPGKDTEPTGIIWHRIVESEFRRKVGDLRRAGPKFSVRIGASQVRFEFLIHGHHLADVIVIVCKFEQAGLARELQHSNGIMVRSVPELHIEMPKKPARVGFPRPPEIVSEFAERFEAFGQSG